MSLSRNHGLQELLLLSPDSVCLEFDIKSSPLALHRRAQLQDVILPGMDQKWGTKNPITLGDDRFGMFEIRALYIYPI